MTTTMTTAKNCRPLRQVLADASSPNHLTELTMRLLFCTTIRAGDHSYRIREIQVYSHDDPYYTQRAANWDNNDTDDDDDDDAADGLSACFDGIFNFHRTKPGGNWRHGTNMGLDITFGSTLIAAGKSSTTLGVRRGVMGGVLIRGMSSVENHKEYFDGSSNCVRELLRACGVSSIQELTCLSDFTFDALTTTTTPTTSLDEDSAFVPKSTVLCLVEHIDPSEPATSGYGVGFLGWKETSRVGLKDPSQYPRDEQATRRKFHRAKLRFVSDPIQTKKDRMKLCMGYHYKKNDAAAMQSFYDKLERTGLAATQAALDNDVAHFDDDSDSDSDEEDTTSETGPTSRNANQDMNANVVASTDSGEDSRTNKRRKVHGEEESA